MPQCWKCHVSAQIYNMLQADTGPDTTKQTYRLCALLEAITGVVKVKESEETREVQETLYKG